MSSYGDTRMDFNSPWMAKLLGSIIGVGVSMVMISPRSWRNGIYRAFIGTLMGFIFAPATQNLLPWLRGDTLDMIVASAVTAGFAVWFFLEAMARFLSSKDTMRRLLEEMVRLGGPPKE
jgi:hypothetical protein